MTSELGIATYPLRRDFESLLEGDEFEALQEDVDYALPGVVARRPLSGDPQVAGGLRMRRQVGDEGDAAGGHRLQAYQAEWLVSAVRQRGSRRRVEHGQEIIGEERRDVPDVGVGLLLEYFRQGGDLFDAGGQ